MEQEQFPVWENDLVEEAVKAAEDRRASEKEAAGRRAVQLAREQAYHRLAVAIDRPDPTRQVVGQLSFWPEETLFDDAG
jgi:hypothetical protein